MRTCIRLIVAAFLLVGLSTALPSWGRAQEENVAVFEPNQDYDIYLENMREPALLVRQVKIVSVTTLNGRSILIVQGHQVGNNATRGYVFLDKVIAVVPSNASTITPVKY